MILGYKLEDNDNNQWETMEAIDRDNCQSVTIEAIEK